MKLRTTVLPLIALAALTTAFGVKSHKKQAVIWCYFSYNWGPPTGTLCQEYTTNQDDCSASNTGAACTTTPGGPVGTVTAYLENITPSCEIVLRQP